MATANRFEQLRRVNSSHKLLISEKCKNGHSRKKYGVFNVDGYLRCRRCMTDAQIRSSRRAAS